MLTNLWAKLDRAQQSRAFKVIASIVVVALAVTVIVTYGVRTAAEAGDMTPISARDILGDEAVAPEAPGATPKTGEQAAQADAEAQAKRQVVAQAESLARFYNRLRERQFSTMGFASVVGLSLIPALGAIWLGIGLTLTLLGALGALIVWPMLRYGGAQWQGFAVFIAGALILTAAFGTLVQLLRLCLSAGHPVTAIARNVVAEAVRLKISLVFIVLLILGLALLPGLLDPDTPLRYRVQSFLQYGATGTFWVSAVLVLVLSAASVAFEQRDKIIWQTMTKPVRPWHYVVGKWLGVTGIAAVLLGVSSTGVFFFADYLRRTGLAVDEVRPYEPAEVGRVATEDRLILESQVLVGRTSVRPLLPNELNREIENALKARLDEAARKYAETNDPADRPDPDKLRKEIGNQALAEFLSVPPNASRMYEFIGVERARSFDLPLTLRYKVNVGANNPTDFHTVTFFVRGSQPFTRKVPAAQMMTMPLAASAIETREFADGVTRDVLTLVVGNFYDEQTPPDKQITMAFPPDGLEVSFAVSSFEGNFLRVALVMWVKLAVIAMVSVVAATFLSFPVACLVGFGTFLMAEGASAVSYALDYFPTTDGQTGETYYWRYPIIWIARPLSDLFKFYSDLAPASKLVEGRLVSWTDVGQSVAVLGLLTLVLALVGAVIFRNRELATYSGR